MNNTSLSLELKSIFCCFAY